MTGPAAETPGSGGHGTDSKDSGELSSPCWAWQCRPPGRCSPLPHWTAAAAADHLDPTLLPPLSPSRQTPQVFCNSPKSCRRIDAFELWCWRRLLRVPWTARRPNQSILKEISPGCSLEGLVLKLKFQYFGHLM